jgi:hypothetical protein
MFIFNCFTLQCAPRAGLIDACSQQAWKNRPTRRISILLLKYAHIIIAGEGIQIRESHFIGFALRNGMKRSSVRHFGKEKRSLARDRPIPADCTMKESSKNCVRILMESLNPVKSVISAVTCSGG